MPSNEIKVIYLAPLPAGRSHVAFRQRWRVHGELAMGLPFWHHMTRYAQCDALTDEELGLGAAQTATFRTAGFGGVGIVTFRDAAALEEASVGSDAVTMTEDEPHVFGRELGANLVPTVEHVVIDGTTGPVTLIAAVHRRPELDAVSFSERWRELGDELVRRQAVAERVTRYVQNHALPGAEYCDGYVELSFSAPGEIAAFIAALEDSGLAAREREFIDYARLEVLVTRVNVLYDLAAGVAPRPSETVAS